MSSCYCVIDVYYQFIIYCLDSLEKAKKYQTIAQNESSASDRDMTMKKKPYRRIQAAESFSSDGMYKVFACYLEDIILVILNI